MEWFDFVMKDGPKPPLLQGNVNFHLMGTNEWRHASTLNDMSNDTLTLYFSPTNSGEYHSLSPLPSETFLEQEVDFEDRSDTTDFQFSVIKDSIKQDLSHSVGFISKPFEKPTIISGACIYSI